MDSYPAPSRLREQTSPPCSRDAHVCPHSRSWWSCFPLVFGLRLSDLTLPPDGCSGRVWVGCRPRPEPFTSSPDPQASAIGDVEEQWRLSPAWGLCFDAKRKAVPCLLSRADWRVCGTGDSERRVPHPTGLVCGVHPLFTSERFLYTFLPSRSSSRNQRIFWFSPICSDVFPEHHAGEVLRSTRQCPRRATFADADMSHATNSTAEDVTLLWWPRAASGGVGRRPGSETTSSQK